MKSTPGPWQACIQDADSGEKWFDIWSVEGSVAHVSEFARPDENLRSLKSDANLIAAAPDLFESLEKILKMIDDGILVRDISNDHRDNFALNQLSFVMNLKQASEAIAKAKGES